MVYHHDQETDARTYAVKRAGVGAAVVPLYTQPESVSGELYGYVVEPTPGARQHFDVDEYLVVSAAKWAAQDFANLHGGAVVPLYRSATARTEASQ